MVTGHSVASGLEFGNHTHTHVTCDHDTAVLPIPMIFPMDKMDAVFTERMSEKKWDVKIYID